MKKFKSIYSGRTIQNGTDQKKLLTVANAHAFSIWGEKIAHGEPFPVFDTDKNIYAYVFPYAIGSRIFPDDLIQNNLQPDVSTSFGAIYIAAWRTANPILRVIHSLHPLFSQGDEAIKIGRSLLNNDAQLNRIYWFGSYQEYFEITTANNSILLDVHSLKQTTLKSIKQGEMSIPTRGYSGLYWKTELSNDISPKEEVLSENEFNIIIKKLASPILPDTGVEKNSQAPLLKLIPLAYCVPVINWTWWCVPTAFAMAVCYYDNYIKNIGGITGYGRLVEYWFDHPKSGHNVPDYIDKSVDPNTGTWREGFTDFADFINKTFGYAGFKTRDIPANASNNWAWNEIMAEIDAGRPFVWGVPNHATCAFGYRITSGGNYVVIHTTWGNTSAEQREEWLYTKGVGLTSIIPSGETKGQNLVIWQPDGNEILNINVPSTISWNIWGDQIKKVDIMVSVDGGNTWSTIIKEYSCSTGWNEYKWVPQIVSDNTRIRIRGFDSNGIFIAGDGSQTNNKVLSGPRHVEIKTILVSAKTDSNGFFSAQHGIENYSPDGNTIHAISVSILHKNGNWHTLEFSNSIDNRFWWNKNIVAGVIGSSNFYEQPVKILIFAEFTIG